MSRFHRSFGWCLVALAALVFGRPALAVSTCEDLQLPPLNPIRIPDSYRFELPNGMVVYLVEDHELPLISVSAIVRTGSLWEPVEKAGLAAITSAVMQTGGTPSVSSEQLSKELDRLGASFQTWVGDGWSGFGANMLKADVDRVMLMLTDLLQHPALPEAKIEQAKTAQRDKILRRYESPTSAVSDEFYRILFGRDTAFGHMSELKTIEAIRREDVVAFNQQFYQTENIILGVRGDFEAQEMRGRIERSFGAWPRSGHSKPSMPTVDSAVRNRTGIYLIPKEDLNQSSVIIGQLGGRMDDPDYSALAVMNKILDARLFARVRAEQGLSFHTESAWDAGWDWPGAFTVSASTKAGTTVKLLNVLKLEVKKLTEDQASEEELRQARDNILHGLPFEFDGVGKILWRLMTYEYYGYPQDHLQRYQENVAKVTPAEVLQVARQHLRPDHFVILVVGNEKEFEQPLSTLGPVTRIDLTKP